MKSSVRNTLTLVTVFSLILITAFSFLGNSVGAEPSQDIFAVPGGERCTAEIHVTDYLDRSLEGFPYRLSYRRGRLDHVTMERGTLDASGVIRFQADVLTGDRSNLIYVHLTDFEFTVTRFSFTRDERHRVMTVSTVPAPGEPAPDADLVELFGGESVRLSDYRGQVIFVDFWASWCHACQGPMAENNAIMARRAKDWEGRAAIIGVSVNDSAEEVRRHIKSRGWTNVRHLWDPTAAQGTRRGVAYQTYGMPYVPSSVLIGPDGTILWRGFSGYANPETLIDRALTGKPIRPQPHDTD